MNLNNNKITSISLIEKIVEFLKHSPESEKWDFKEWEPRSGGYIELTQINILCELFAPEYFIANNVKSNILNVIKGGFILRRSLDTYSEVLTKMNTEINRGNPHPNDIEWDLFRLRADYEDLFKYKIDLEQIVKPRGTIIEMSPKYSYTYSLKRKVSRSIEFSNIDSHLASIIDPLNRSFTIEQLKNDYNYPLDIVTNDF